MASLVVPCRLQAQAPTYSPQDVDAGKVLPLDLKPGCWQVRSHKTSALPGVLTPDVLADMRKRAAEMAAARQKAGDTTADADKIAAALEQNMRQSMAFGESAAKLGEGSQTVICTAGPFREAGIAAYGTLNPASHCTRDIQVSGEDRHIHLECLTVPDADRSSHITDDFERIDSDNVRGMHTTVEKQDNGLDATSTTLFAGKRIDDAAPHMPHAPAPTDIGGKKILGPLAVAWLDPFRIVATIGGRQFLATQAYVLLHFATPRAAKEYGPQLSDVLQQIFMHAGVARDALLMHLDIQQPWQNQLQNAGYTNQTLAPFGSIIAPQGPQDPFNFHAIWALNDALAVPATWTDAHLDMARASSVTHQAAVDIFWNAYFSQAKTEAEKQALLHKVQETYKVTVIDPDFFFNVETGHR